MAQYDRRERNTVEGCRWVALPSHATDDGCIAVAENGDSLPFAVGRVYYIYDIPTDAMRGGHAHRTEERLMVAVSGCFDVKVFDGEHEKTFTLRRPNEALYIPSGIWREVGNFSAGSVCLALCAGPYDGKDYIGSLQDYKQWLNSAL